jgi:hypothetical protein
MDRVTSRDLQNVVQPVVNWLVDGARTVRQPQDLLAELCQRLIAVGLPLHRVAVFVRTLHPNVMGRRFLWKPEVGVEITEAPYDFLAADTYLKSPLPAVFRTGRAIRRRLSDPDCPRDFIILAELAAGASPTIWSPRSTSATARSTRSPGPRPARVGLRTATSRRSRRSGRRSRASPRSMRCGGSRRPCSAPTSAAAAANASSRDGSGAATSSASARSSCSRTCAGSRPSATGCRASR